MCVILVCPENVRPKPAVLYACHEANPHGAGVAWREGGRVRWQKNLSAGEVMTLTRKLEGEVVIHFRWASVGGVDPRLCHPFPVTPKSTVGLSGMAETVLFHNGTWCDYREALERLETHRKEPLPGGPLSDTRAAALVVHTTGPDVLQRLPGRWVWMNAAETLLFGPWEEWRGMQVSNSHFVPRLRAAEARRKTTPRSDHRPRTQATLFAR
ncbi:MAG: hypothetical protein KDK97_13465 [Verrucomicrobiales bacterium]|nr:hypothetical protein [Verrucomicrobiales bacterium]